MKILKIFVILKISRQKLVVPNYNFFIIWRVNPSKINTLWKFFPSIKIFLWKKENFELFF
jgi:hypothetical protein